MRVCVCVTNMYVLSASLWTDEIDCAAEKMYVRRIANC